MTNTTKLHLALLLLFASGVGCGSSDQSLASVAGSGEGGKSSQGGTPTKGGAPNGGVLGTGENVTGGAGTGGSSAGGAPASAGGAAVGGRTSGGASTGGVATGGTATGGSPAGGSASGGTTTGGAAMGGKSTGGTNTGGVASGGTTSGGNPAGGNASGGTSAGGAAMGGKSTGGTNAGGVASGGISAGGSPAAGNASGGTSTGGTATGGSGVAPSRCAGGSTNGRVMECLDRGVVAMRTGNSSVFVSWRLFGTDAASTTFNLYRQTGTGTPALVCSAAANQGTNCTDSGATLSQANTYFVRPVIDGIEQTALQSGSYTLSANAPTQQYLSIPLTARSGFTVPHVWVGDLNGDGEYEYVVVRVNGSTGPQYVEAYSRGGQAMWQVNMGPNSNNLDNIEPGSATLSVGHNDGLTVYDLDSDGRAEVLLKSANGTVFGDGTTLSNSNDNVQFLSVLEGTTGRELIHAQMPNPVISDGPLSGQMGIGYFDGTYPSVVFKGKNRVGSGDFNLVMTAWDYRNGAITQRWTWRRTNQNAPDFHQIRVVDVDQDGKDEVADGGYVIDDNGTYFYAVPGAVHGDRFHIGDFDPDHAGLEGFGIQQSNSSGLQMYYYDARTGAMLHAFTGDVTDMARGNAGDLDPTHRGYEFWSFSGLYTVQSEAQIVADGSDPWPNFRIWWDGDTLSENLNQNWVSKWNNASPDRDGNKILRAASLGAIYGARDAPAFYGDIMGDWREEVIWEQSDNAHLLIFTTTTPSTTRLYTLPHNPEYRNCMTVKGYMQSHQIDYYLGDGMTIPPPVPNIRLANRP